MSVVIDHFDVKLIISFIGRPEAAVKYYDKAIGINSAHHVAIVNKGRLLRKFGQHEQAEKLFRR